MYPWDHSYWALCIMDWHDPSTRLLESFWQLYAEQKLWDEWILVNSIAELLQSKEGFLAPLLTTFPWSLKCTTVLCSPCNFQVILMSCFSHISLMGMFSRSRLLFAVFWWSSGPVKFLKSLLEQGPQHQVRVSHISKKKSIHIYLT